jgi:serine/threonine protein kinase/tetratricopeptide (TPR) repeat protein
MNEQTIFTLALEREPNLRWAFLAEVCGTDVQLRERVERLLRLHDGAGGFLEQSAAADVGLMLDQPSLEGPGTHIGPYKLLEQVGEGGFGVVFMAEQLPPLRRRVALKVLKPGMDTRQVVARFEAERQALALMDHPNIARVLDGGATASGRPYFVMELVPGIPITDFCDQNHVPPAERLELFISICRAVQHAHQKGIIHRDLKPSNVLVTLHDGTPVVKVIDFGIAKALGEQLTEKTLFTSFTHMMGTPLYMSPEQASFSGLDVDTRSDVYSLGVLLYELLTGTTPFEKERLRNADLDEMRRILREEEPPRPSTQVSTLAVASDTVTANRQTSAKHLSLLLRGELDWIVMKCLSKDRTRRYESVSALAADLRRYLQGESIEARPPSVVYRFRKFVRRNRVAITTTGLVAAILVLGTSISTWQAFRATEAERLTRGALAAEKRARQDAEADRQRADANFQNARQAVDRYYTLVSQGALLDEPGLQSLRKDLLEAALAYYQRFLSERAGDPRLRVELAATHIRAGSVCHLIDRNDEAIAHLKNGLDLVEGLLADPRNAAAIQQHLPGVYKAGRTLHGGTRPPSDPQDALRTLQRGAEIWERLVRAHPQTIDFQSDLAGFYLLIGHLQRAFGQRPEATQSYERATAILQHLVGERPKVADYRADLSSCYEILGLMAGVSGRAAEAEQALKQSLELREKLVEEFPERPGFRLELASAYRELATQVYAGQASVVREQLQKAGQNLNQLVVDHPGIPVYEEQLARLQMSLAEQDVLAGQLASAQESYGQALAIFESLARKYPKSSYYRERLVLCLHELILVQSASGKAAEAQQAYQRIIALQKSLAVEFATVPRYQEQLAWFLVTCPYDELRDPALAVQAARAATEWQPGDGDHWRTLGAAYYRSKDFGRAVESLNKSLALPPGPKSTNRFFLAMAHWQLANPRPEDPQLTEEMRAWHRAQARQFYEEATQWMQKHRPNKESTQRLRAEAEQLLAKANEGTVR